MFREILLLFTSMLLCHVQQGEEYQSTPFALVSDNGFMAGNIRILWDHVCYLTSFWSHILHPFCLVGVGK